MIKINDNGTITCKVCKRDVSIENYDCKHYKCKLCQKEYLRLYYIKNKEKLNEYCKNYLNTHREENKINCKKYYNSHKYEHSVYSKNYYMENKDKILAYSKEWRKQNIDKCRIIDVNKRKLGYNPINTKFNWFDAHHLHLECNINFVIFLPRWLHLFIHHRPKTWVGMDTINAIALDYWINEEFYLDLYDLKS